MQMGLAHSLKKDFAKGNSSSQEMKDNFLRYSL